MTIAKNITFESIILEELIINRLRRFQANLFFEDNERMESYYDHAIYTLSLILGRFYNKPITELSDFIDELIFPLLKNGYDAGPFIDPYVVDMFIFELGQKLDYSECEFENIV